MASPGKAALRRQLLAARRAVAADARADQAAALCRHLDTLTVRGHAVAAYVPVGAEPGSLELLEVLRRRRLRVLLPVARTTADAVPTPLAWGVYRPGRLVTAAFGLLEPAGPWLPASALGTVDLVLVPALAVDVAGARLGRGGGFYDRSLPFRNPRAPLVAVIRDEELLPEVPSEPHDVPMSHALTPARGLVALGTDAAGITPAK